MNKYLGIYQSIILTIIPFFCLLSQEKEEEIIVNYTVTNEYLATVFDDLEEKYNINFSFATASILDQKVDCDFKDSSMEDVLDYLLEEQSLEYKQIGENYLVRKSSSYKEQTNDEYKSSLHLTGKITLHNTDEVLSYATISILNSTTGTYANENGEFDLEIPFHHLTDTLVVQYVGMEEKIYAIKDVKDAYLLVGLTNGMYDLEEVVIINRRQKINVFNDLNAIGINFSYDSFGGILTNDLTRQLQKIAGINATDDTSADIKIRGSKSDETLIVLDGMPIYNCSHYYGIFNSINTEFISNLNLYKSYIPLEYGGKTGGIVELKSLDEKNIESSAEVNVDLMTASSNIKLKLTDNLSWNIAGRTTLRNISNTQFNTFGQNNSLDELVIEEFTSLQRRRRSDPIFSFYDANTKILWQPSSKHSISLSGFISDDSFSNTYTSTFRDRNTQELSLLATETEDWNNQSFSLNHEMTIKDQSTWKTTLYSSDYNNEGHINFTIQKPNLEDLRQSDQFDIDLEQENRIQNLGIKSYINKNIKNAQVVFGLEAIEHTIAYNVDDNSSERIRDSGKFNDLSGFTSIKYSNWDLVTVRLGLRTTYFEGTEGIHLSPRAFLQLKLNDRIKLKGSYGIYQQFVRELEYEFRGEPMSLWVNSGGNDIPVLESNNLTVGFNALLNAFSLNVEFYRKDFTGLTEFSVINPGRGNMQDGPGDRDYQLFIGNGFTQGVDVSIQRTMKKYSTYIGYTLSESKKRFDEIFINNYFPSEDDRRHQLKWVNVIRLGSWHLGADWIFTSGSPFYDLENFSDGRDIRNTAPENGFEYVDAYNRVDVNLARNFDLGPIQLNAYVSVLNLFNHENTKYVQSVSENLQRNSTPLNLILSNESALLNRTFNIGFKAKFKK